MASCRQPADHFACICECAPRQTRGGVEPHLSIRLAIHFRTNTKYEHNDKCERVEVEDLFFPLTIHWRTWAPGHILEVDVFAEQASKRWP